MGVVTAVPGILIKGEDDRNSQETLSSKPDFCISSRRIGLERARSQLEEKKSKQGKACCILWAPIYTMSLSKTNQFLLLLLLLL